ncbi:hypothetical protein [Polyangium spumosum]|uniref:Uncharacterized protein n=1 Tax=Polyangium spumosum TaxID=889282 RepID=A0A6N7Q419_9BACT|nr:hypothetical protein [Polyangium spumosum]MRG97054.1 hypothetical protein [Polyangium spumosum]
MNTLRSISGLFAMASLFAFAAGCSVGEKEEFVGQGEQQLIDACECPVVGGTSNLIAPPECDCPPEEEPPVEEPPADECPPDHELVCQVKAPSSGTSSLIAPPDEPEPECECVPVEAPCPPHAVEVTTCGGILAPKGAASIWGGSGACSTQCVLPY